MTNNKIILGFVGPIASGKGTACRYLKERYQAETYRFSTMLYDILNRVNIETNRENLQKVSSVLRETFGDDLMAKTIAHDVTQAQSEVVSVDGVRREPDIKYLKQIPGFFLVAINAEPKTRYERLIKRGEKPDDNTKTYEQFLEDDKKEAERQIIGVAAKADFKIDNNGSIEELHNQIEKIIKKARS
jgi:dephospho-CoA kinase